MTDVEGIGMSEDRIDDMLFFDVDDHVDLGFLMDMDDEPHSCSSSSSSPAPPALSIGQIENILLNDDVSPEVDGADDFFADIFLDSPVPSSTVSSDNHPPSPDIASLQQPQSQPLSDEEAAKDSSASDLSPSPSPEEAEAEEEEDNDDDPQTKKRKRQLRNRDAAVRSRERKKMYVKDLEAKSRYFESECKRLGMVLQCVMAENHSLRLAMYNNQAAYGASTTRQESAVLFMESLLLGSLLWLVGVMGLLLLLPSRVLLPLLAARPGRRRSLGLESPRKEAPPPCKAMELRQAESYLMSKGCRGSWRKMRSMPPAVILLRWSLS